MNLRTQIKKDAKKALSNYWAKAIAVFLLMLAIVMFFTIMSSILDMAAGIGGYLDVYRTTNNYLDDVPNISILSLTMTGLLTLGMLLIMIPMRLGIKRWYYLLSDGFSDDLLSIFHFFSSGKLLLRSIALELQLAVRTLFWSVLMFAPAGLCGWGAWYFTQQTENMFAPLYATLLVLFAFLLAIAGGVLLLVQLNRYFLAKFYVLTKNISAYRAVKLSCRNTRGMRGKIFAFHLSFIGWFALSGFVVPMLYVQPYYAMSCVLYARYLMESAERKSQPVQQGTSQEETPEAEASKQPVAEPEESIPAQKVSDKMDVTGQWPINQDFDGEGKNLSGGEPGTGFILVDTPTTGKEQE